MNVCIPSRDDRGLESELHDHFGSTPWFTIVNTETGEVTPLANPSCGHAPGSCHHVGILRARSVDAVVSSGMGRRAWSAFHDAGIQVFSASHRRVGDILEQVRAGTAMPFSLEGTCDHGSSASQGRGHAHGHGPGRRDGSGHAHDGSHRRCRESTRVS
jgi:predicted Fe-Mo cluster-binding NifX family protein